MSKKDKENSSMFQLLLEKARSREPEAEEIIEADLMPDTNPVTEASPMQQTEKRGPGRPRGRRSNPDYTQISAYVPLDLYLEVQTALVKEKKAKRVRRSTDVSGLVENLLRDWVEHRKDE